MLHYSREDEGIERSLRGLWKHYSSKVSDIPPLPISSMNYQLKKTMRFNIMWIDKLVKIKWRGRMDSRVVAIVKSEKKSRSLSRAAWKPIRCLHSQINRKEVHKQYVTREYGWPKTYSIPFLTIQDAAGMVCKSSRSFHAFTFPD